LPYLRFEVELRSDATILSLRKMIADGQTRPAAEAVRCPDCGAPMVCVRTFPKLGNIPEMRSYRCVECGHIETGSVTGSRNDLHVKGAIL
jgi:DNA-directed RNA polymerase subunit M/transcription elongation factor TFIIS